MLALMPVVALAAACNGVAPTASTDLATDVAATTGGAVAAQGLRPINPCKYVEGIHLQVIEEKTAVWVEAKYKYSQLPPTDCAAPTFTSNVPGLQVDKANPYRAGLLRAAGTTAKITATAPNGVSEGIQVDLTLPGNTDPVTTTPTLTPTTSDSPADAACKVVAGVTVTAHRFGGTGGDVVLLATYTYLATPVSRPCTAAPVWAATRRGLTVDSTNAFRARIPVSDFVKTTVSAAAPNGVLGEVTF